MTPWESHVGAGSKWDLWPHGERSPHCSSFAGRTLSLVEDPHCSNLSLKDCILWGGTHAGGVHDEVQPLGRTDIREVYGKLPSMGGTPHRSRRRV